MRSSNWLRSERHEAWHATPLELVLDVQLDSRLVVESNLVAGTTIPVPGELVKVFHDRISLQPSKSR